MKISRKVNVAIEKIKHITTINKKKQLYCKAPFVSMSISINGYISPCCYIHSSILFYAQNNESYPNKSLTDIWNSLRFQNYRSLFNKGIFPSECSICQSDFSNGDFESAKAKMYEKYDIYSKYPKVIELTLDNTCNLNCIMCNSVLSSKIAQKRNVSNKNEIDKDLFIKEISYFIPYLEEIIISGGEPLASEFCIKLMREIIVLNPKCVISVNTNGTILNDEIKQLMFQGNFQINLSIDSIHKDTYEKIRLGANFEKVMGNFTFYSEYLNKKNKGITITICPLILNFKELPELVNFCNQKNAFIQFVHVFNAHDVALSSADSELLEDAVKLFESCSFARNSKLQIHNAKQFSSLINDLKIWKEFAVKKELFLSNLEIDEQGFLDANEIFEQKINKYVLTHKTKLLDVELFNHWKYKKDDLFSVLPFYFKNELFYSQIFIMSEDVIFSYILDLPLEELKQYFITFGDEIIANHLN